MFYLPCPKNMDILNIPDESNNIEDYLEFYLSLNWGFSDVYHPCLSVNCNDYEIELYDFIQKSKVIKKHKIFYRKGKYGKYWYPLTIIDLVNSSNSLPLSPMLLTYLISLNLLSICGNKGDEYIQYTLHWNVFLQKYCIDDFWNKFYAIQNKNDLVDTNYVKEYYKIQNKNGVLSKNEIKELAQLHIPMPEDKEIEKKINEENGVGRNSPEYRKFTKDVLERDEYKCQCCGSTINPEVHHIKNYRQYKNLRTDVNNGITLCEKHHSMNIIDGFHQVYGTYNNTPEQLIEYIKKRQKDLNITDFSFVRSPFVIDNVSVYNDDELVCNDCDDDYAS